MTDNSVKEMETRFAQEDGLQTELVREFQAPKGLIMPLRLQFNDLLNTMATIDQNKGKSAHENFQMVRAKVIALNSQIQEFSRQVKGLEPRFESLEKYATEMKTSKFAPLETLSRSSEAAAVQQSKNVSGISGLSGGPSVASGPSPASAAARASYSSANTPNSSVSTPSGAQGAAARKPKRSRAKKNSVSGSMPGSMPSGMSSGMPGSVPGTQPLQQMSLAPQQPQQQQHHQMPMPSANPGQILANMSPANMMSSPMNVISPMNTGLSGVMGSSFSSNSMMTSANKPQTAPQQRQAVPTPQQINMSNITPANILTMSMMDKNMNNPAIRSQPQQQPAQQPQPQQQQQPTPQPRTQTQQLPQVGSNDFTNLDLNNLDLSNLNMDFF
ncbi:LAMI_0D06678g1_1 [Lachancea mirantina]|uniref:LAMI_0D06678g1_1 n=1 Tax=Lachancea mirantina TaxID=1230905 RepID=A0A1G4JCG7_9SACH|nr:LAMI_0D06678g1_1 [Lachancea mirantina]